MASSLHSVTKAGCVVMSAISTRKRHNTASPKKQDQWHFLPMFNNKNGTFSKVNGTSVTNHYKTGPVGTCKAALLLQRLSVIIKHPRHKRKILLLSLTFLCLYGMRWLGYMLNPPPPFMIRREGMKPQNITVVLMNHARPRNIQESPLLPTLLENEHITEVLLLHSNPPLAFEYRHSKVKNINATLENAKLGLSLRFWFCGVASKNDWVILVDDDMLVPQSTLQGLIDEFTQNPNRIVGIYGRTLSLYYKTAPITKGYNTRNVQGPTEVVLTKMMIMERNICPYFHEYAHLVDDLTVTSHPHWNGEDIFMSLVANHVYGHGKQYDTRTQFLANRGQNNYAMPWLPVSDVEDKYKDANESDGHLDVSGNFNHKQFRPWDSKWRQNLHKAFSHLWYRGDLWKKARKRLKKQPIVEQESRANKRG
jgi:hypothetical protein